MVSSCLLHSSRFTQFIRVSQISLPKMKAAQVIIALFVVALLGQAYAQSNAMPTFDCTDKSGYFADAYRLCHVFYYCYPDGRKLTMSCPEGTTFNQITTRCEVGSPCFYSA
ncbi:uncharacterized protein LOC110849326 [Folsomia candida]|uniref:Chitin-binding type-2 domain-containing protein n=1 Tax=Folsomia candida TaxID=158441 RepID=A0A226EE52_FOLCA|nr:uncharacterized protein LOC110849326 [Folsomia candida]OXA55825.1 hypothetical protein Fcan01_09656 [Folsomia candida]